MSFTLFFAPGYITCVFWIVNNQGMIFYKIIDNFAFLRLIPTLLEQLLQENCISLANITKIVIFTGPAPLTTARTAASWSLGLSRALNIPLQQISGTTLWKPLTNAHLFLQAFGGYVYYTDANNVEVKISTEVAQKLINELPENSIVYYGYKTPLTPNKIHSNASVWYIDPEHVTKNFFENNPNINLVHSNHFKNNYGI